VQKRTTVARHVHYFLKILLLESRATFNAKCVNVTSLDSQRLPWVNEMKYLSIYLSVLNHLNVVYMRLSDPSIDQQMKSLVKSDVLHPKMSHYSSFKVNVYLPYYMDLKHKADLNSLDFVVNRFFMKLLSTNNIHILQECQQMFQFEFPSEQLEKKEKEVC